MEEQKEGTHKSRSGQGRGGAREEQGWQGKKGIMASHRRGRSLGACTAGWQITDTARSAAAAAAVTAPARQERKKEKQAGLDASDELLCYSASTISFSSAERSCREEREGGREQRAAWSRAQWQNGQEKAQVEGLKKCCVAAGALMVSVAVAMGVVWGTGPSGGPALPALVPVPRRCRWRFCGLAPRRRAVSQPCSALADGGERERPIAFLFASL